MAQLFKNAARSPLQASILAADTSLTVDAALADLFPVATTDASAVGTGGLDWFKAVLQDTSGNIEIVYVRTRALGDANFTNVIRGQEGTTARNYAAGSIVGLRLTAADYEASLADVGVRIAAATAKATPVDSDTLALSDSAASGVLKKLTWANLKAGVFTAFGALIGAAASKATPIDADALVVMDSAASNATKQLTWANIKATLKSYFDGLYASTSRIQFLSASVAANALTITVNPTVLDFRSATLTSGAVNTRTLASAASLVISSGSTLGTTSAVQSRIAVLLIDNAGTLEVAAGNIAGGVNLDETGVISTTAEGGAGAADSATVFYSTTARSNVPYRLVGYIESTQATAGTWATAPSTIQGIGGQALAALSSFGYGQTWQDMTASRAFNTAYPNTTGKSIAVSINVVVAVAGATPVVTMAGLTFYGSSAPAGNLSAINLIVPHGKTISVSNGSMTSIFSWLEMRS